MNLKKPQAKGFEIGPQFLCLPLLAVSLSLSGASAADKAALPSFDLHQLPAGDAPFDIQIGDFDRDGDLDIGVSNLGSNSIVLCLVAKDDQGKLAVTRWAYKTGRAPVSLFAADLDGDGDIDLGVTNISANTVNLLINEGKRRFAKRAAFQVGARFPFALVGADLDRDGRVDLVTANLVDDNVSVLLHRPDGALSFAKSYPVGNGPRAVAAGDFNGDGLIDLVVVNRPEKL